jgi:hypothetical protein
MSLEKGSSCTLVPIGTFQGLVLENRRLLTESYKPGVNVDGIGVALLLLVDGALVAAFWVVLFCWPARRGAVIITPSATPISTMPHITAYQIRRSFERRRRGGFVGGS